VNIKWKRDKQIDQKRPTRFGVNQQILQMKFNMKVLLCYQSITFAEMNEAIIGFTLLTAAAALLASFITKA